VSSYRGTAARPDKAKAIAAVMAVHAALAFVILSGLHVREIRHAVDQLTTISIREPPAAPPPPVQLVQPTSKPQVAKDAEGAPAKNAQPTPIVAPQPRLPVSSPVAAAQVAGTGAATNSGAAVAGNGTGAGGSGRGPGGGGTADYSGFTPARLVENIPNREYPRLASTGIPSGLVGVIILVGPQGTASNCRVARSSGDPSIDSLVCQLTVRYVRFDPARDPYGRAVAQDVTYFPNWRRR
jgi:periplasmic protein TonB